MKEIKRANLINIECDYCSTNGHRIMFDAPTTLGPWALLCTECMDDIGVETSVTVRLVHTNE